VGATIRQGRRVPEDRLSQAWEEGKNYSQRDRMLILLYTLFYVEKAVKKRDNLEKSWRIGSVGMRVPGCERREEGHYPCSFSILPIY
jgi:hypothetical protein